jgi:RNase P subunit RPR2
MRITCPSCGNTKKFLIPLWCRVTFRFTDEGTITILHVKQLESLEEKLTNQNTYPTLTCQECGADARIEFNEYENLDESRRLKMALGEL